MKFKDFEVDADFIFDKIIQPLICGMIGVLILGFILFILLMITHTPLIFIKIVICITVVWGVGIGVIKLNKKYDIM